MLYDVAMKVIEGISAILGALLVVWAYRRYEDRCDREDKE